jgi:hypothetical protein
MQVRYQAALRPDVVRNKATVTQGQLMTQAPRVEAILRSNEQVCGEQFTKQDADFHDLQYRIYQAGSEDFTPFLADGKCAFTDIYTGVYLILDTAI